MGCKGSSKINDVGCAGNVNKYVTQIQFRCFKESDTNLEDKPRPVLEDENMFKVVEQQPSTGACTLLVKLDRSPSAPSADSFFQLTLRAGTFEKLLMN